MGGTDMEGDGGRGGGEGVEEGGEGSVREGERSRKKKKKKILMLPIELGCSSFLLIVAVSLFPSPLVV